MVQQSDLRRTETLTDHLRTLLSQMSAGEIHNVAMELSRLYADHREQNKPIAVTLCEALSRFASQDPSNAKPTKPELTSEEEIRDFNEHLSEERARQKRE